MEPPFGIFRGYFTARISSSWVSAVDMTNLLSMFPTLMGEIFAVIFSLLLLYRIPNTMPECEAPLETRLQALQGKAQRPLPLSPPGTYRLWGIRALIRGM